MGNRIEMIDDIKNWLANFTNSFPSVSFRLMYDEVKDCVLISYNVPSYIDDNDSIWDEISAMKYQLRNAYSGNEPLFSQGDTVFKLSADAQSVCCKQLNVYANTFEVASAQQYTFSLSSDISCFLDGYENFLLAA